MPKFTLADFRKDLSPKYKLVPKLDRAIAGFDEEWDFHYVPKEHDLYWHPSSHCVPLASELYDLARERLNHGPKPDEETQRPLRKYGPVGHFWHQFLQHIMVRYDMCELSDVEREGFKAWTPLVKEPGVSAKWDARPFHACVGQADVAPWTHKDHDYIVDFKTMASRNFQRVALPDSFAAKYICQMNIYMDLFGYDRALIVAINKDTPHDFKEFEYRLDHDLVDLIYAKWVYVAGCLEDGQRPDADDDAHFALPELI
jgi:hypothetical protein